MEGKRQCRFSDVDSCVLWLHGVSLCRRYTPEVLVKGHVIGKLFSNDCKKNF